MTVSSSAQLPPITPPSSTLPFVEKGLTLTNYALQLLQKFHQTIVGLSPTISCSASTTSNVITLTPFNISPNLPGYFNYWSFAFVADVTSTGTVTATVVPATGTLATLPVYKNDGGTAAGAGDIVITRFYVLYYVDSLNSGNGGLVLK